MPTNMPDITKAQIGAALVWVVSQAVAYGWIKHGPDQQTLSGAATVLAVGIAWADAHLRGKRVDAHAAVVAANAYAAAAPVATTTPAAPAADIAA